VERRVPTGGDFMRGVWMRGCALVARICGPIDSGAGIFKRNSVRTGGFSAHVLGSLPLRVRNGAREMIGRTALE
jgi:hypothetical protein